MGGSPSEAGEEGVYRVLESKHSKWYNIARLCLTIRFSNSLVLSLRAPYEGASVRRGAPLLYEVTVENDPKLRVHPEKLVRRESAPDTDPCLLETRSRVSWNGAASPQRRNRSTVQAAPVPLSRTASLCRLHSTERFRQCSRGRAGLDGVGPKVVWRPVAPCAARSGHNPILLIPAADGVRPFVLLWTWVLCRRSCL
jgi:hypothetical protein